MTLAGILPSLGIASRQTLDPRFWPSTARLRDGELTVGGVPLTAAGHVLDETCVRASAAGFAAAFGAGGCSYSAKAGLTPDIARWIAGAGLGCYATTGEQLRIALAAGVAPERLVLTGPDKTISGYDIAFACGAAVVIGSPGEAHALIRRAPAGQRVLVRTIASGQHRPRRYGVRLGSSTALDTIRLLTGATGLRFTGLDCSLGHDLTSFGTFERCLREAIAFTAVLHSRRRPTTARRQAPGIAAGRPADEAFGGGAGLVINLGGGQADDLPVAVFAARMRGVARVNAERYRIPDPLVRVSPGRALTGRAGITVCRVEHVLRDRRGRLIAGLAGDLPSGNGQTALVGRVSAAAPEPAMLCGEGTSATAELPGDLKPGDLLALAGTGVPAGRHH
ncbi:MAG TPA: hypothetical protein VN408_18460 [Actinoplanes sp.]|nr:hypothetical protein [Actinoplanes sp.]